MNYQQEYKVTNASAITGTCILTNTKSGEKHTVKLDNWNWINSFYAMIYFTFKGRKFEVCAELEPDYSLVNLYL